ncbi:hypothetical protein GCM10010840_29970 [Deinococcus aerolatus]|uniref:XRE family transcriptional regulator n=1 Tax=Deinococcus aerolatus TaxID=522487 RepID=A0ABQ2GEF2_9DEIO|nr:hypothetical protein [Deinococcus aerolatus]GGL89944.1 hypothetical protein GCM10010840_29970 [Deinococcus aerolatus]
MAIRLTLKTFLEVNELKVLQVEVTAREKLGLPLGQNTLYRMMAKERIEKIDLVAVNSLLESLSDLTGRSVQLNEIFAFERGVPQ